MSGGEGEKVGTEHADALSRLVTLLYRFRQVQGDATSLWLAEHAVLDYFKEIGRKDVADAYLNIIGLSTRSSGAGDKP